MEPTGKSIRIGGLVLGGNAPVRIQSMCNTDTNDIGASVAQCIRMIEAGAELVRLTTQGSREVASLATIRQRLHDEGYGVPVIADIHFRPGLALEAVEHVDKVRINPGNYLKGGDVESLLPELLGRCKEYGTAIRIGVNHGSLSQSIVEEFGDTPRGMVESAMRFLRVCRREGMDRVVVSMKSSNPRIMIQSVRLLKRTMEDEGMDFPLHLGVTEAGDGLDGRLKSAVGMAPLLMDGLGDTIRVSLTEAPENELPVARMITELFPKPGKRTAINDPERSRADSNGGRPKDPKPEGLPFEGLGWDPYYFSRRKSVAIGALGGAARVKIISEVPPVDGEDLKPGALADQEVFYVDNREMDMQAVRSLVSEHCTGDRDLPIVFHHFSQEPDPDRYRLQLAGELGYLLVDGAVDAVRASNTHFDAAFINEALLIILQAAGARMSKTEYIACPSCGRTHFDILERLREIREATAHLKPIKIGVMGCIVNGPGEMADADYGYVGAGRGKVSLYRRKEAVAINIPEEEALQALIDLIKREGDWIEQ